MEAHCLHMHVELPAVPIYVCKNLREELHWGPVMFVSSAHVQAVVQGLQIALVHAVLAVELGLRAENATEMYIRLMCALALPTVNHVFGMQSLRPMAPAKSTAASPRPC